MTKPTEQQIRKLADELSKLTGFIADFGRDNELHSNDVTFACNVSDALSWVLGDITTVHFMEDDYLKLDLLWQMSETIEKRTGQNLHDYK